MPPDWWGEYENKFTSCIAVLSVIWDFLFHIQQQLLSTCILNARGLMDTAKRTYDVSVMINGINNRGSVEDAWTKCLL